MCIILLFRLPLSAFVLLFVRGARYLSLMLLSSYVASYPCVPWYTGKNSQSVHYITTYHDFNSE